MNKTTKTFIAVVLGLIVSVIGGVVGSHISAPPSAPVDATAKVVGGSDIVENFPSFWANGINIGQSFEQNVALTLGARQNQVAWLNNTGQTVFFDLSRVYPSGIASTTLQVSVGTSTTATVTDSSNPFFASFIDRYLLATSTQPAINNFKDGGTNGRTVIPVAPNQYFLMVLENPYNQACTGSTCETATSTNRGYNLFGEFEYRY